jgi:superfamily II DNA helicase RecQ
LAPLSATTAAALGLVAGGERDVAFRRALRGAQAAWISAADAQAWRLAFYAAAATNRQRALLISPSAAALGRDRARLTAAKLGCVHLSIRDGAVDAQALRRIERGEFSVVLALSEVLALEDVARVLARADFGAIAVDEAELLAPSANGFRPSFRHVAALLAKHARVPLCLLSRPARSDVRSHIASELGRGALLELGTPLLPGGVVVDAWPVRGERRNFGLLTLLGELTAPGVVLCASPHEVDATFAVLSAAGVLVCRAHAGMPAADRQVALARFHAEGQPPLVLLTTSAVGPDSGLSGIGEAEDSEARPGFGLGPTRRDLRFLIHYHAPSSFEQYARELAWLGADGEAARAVTLYDSAARSLNDAIFEQQRVPGRQLRELGRVLREALTSARQPTLEWLALQSGLSRRTTERIVALLSDAAVIRRSGKGVEAREAVDGLEQRCEELAVRLDALRAADRVRLAAIERWAEGRECRSRTISQYFGAESASCGLCAGCVALPSAQRHEQRRTGGARG